MSDLLTISEVAEILGVGEDTVTRRFAKVKGVIDLGSPETPKRRRYRVLRIPKSVVEKFLLARGGPVDIKTPTRPPKRKAPTPRHVSPNWEDDVIRELATMRKQRGAEAQKTMDRIAERARLLTFVPESQWSDVVWFDEEE
jgi:2-succinyl-5-enolpyruvyl-6-hydroxy-3-cyclohexene-1-carboxylate synthase